MKICIFRNLLRPSLRAHRTYSSCEGPTLKTNWVHQQEIALQAHVPPTYPEVLREQREFLKNASKRFSRPLPKDAEDELRVKLADILKRPPLPGKGGKGWVQIKLLEQIKSPSFGNEGLFLARVMDSSSDMHHMKAEDVVAEIYDPLIMGRSIYADLAYVNGSMTYQRLKQLQGKVIPKFYGSYTTKVREDNHPKKPYRDVRVILRQYIQGTGLNKIDPQWLSREGKERLMERVIELEQTIQDCGVYIMMSYDPHSVIVTDKTDMSLVFWRPSDAVNSDSPMWSQGKYAEEMKRNTVDKWLYENEISADFQDYVTWDWGAWLKRKYGSSNNDGSSDIKGDS